MDEERGSGWLLFAATVLIVAGVMRFFDAIWAFRVGGSVGDQYEDLLFGRSLNTYGWVWIFVGVILVLTGLAVMSRSQFARWLGIVGGAVATIQAIWWMPIFPVWSLVYTAIGLLVIYALAAHGGRATSEV